jgi:hypothetical protein
MILNLAAEFNVREASVRVSPWMVSDRVANDANRLDFALGCFVSSKASSLLDDDTP